MEDIKKGAGKKPSPLNSPVQNHDKPTQFKSRCLVIMFDTLTDNISMANAKIFNVNTALLMEALEKLKGSPI